jgi:hypothetical protein
MAWALTRGSAPRRQTSGGEARRTVAPQWPAEPGTRQSCQSQPDCRRRNTYSPGNLVEPDLTNPQTKHFVHRRIVVLSAGIRSPRAKTKGADPNRASRGVAYPSEIIQERRARSNRHAGRDHHGFAGDFRTTAGYLLELTAYFTATAGTKSLRSARARSCSRVPFSSPRRLRPGSFRSAESSVQVCRLRTTNSCSRAWRG